MQVILTGNTKGLALVWTCGHGLEFFTSVEKRRQYATRYLEHTKSSMKHANEALYASFPHSILACEGPKGRPEGGEWEPIKILAIRNDRLNAKVHTQP